MQKQRKVRHPVLLLVIAAVAGLAIAGIIMQLPEIKRYAKSASM